MSQKTTKKTGTKILIALMIFAGCCCLLYPIYNNYMFAKYSAESQAEYEAAVAQKDAAYKEEAYAKARLYNSTLDPVSLIDPFSVSENPEGMQQEYEDAFNLTRAAGIDGVMGFISIPKINVDLPIFHGTEDEKLQNGSGHLIGSSLPTGDTGTHAVLTGHSGLTSAKLFTDLEQLEIGDQFIITILDEKMAYEVDNITVIEPTDKEWFTIDPDKTEVTLMTCTPIGINSHRLLVTGHRIPYEDLSAVTPVVDWYKVIVLSLLGLGAILLLVLGIRKAMKKRAEKGTK